MGSVDTSLRSLVIVIAWPPAQAEAGESTRHSSRTRPTQRIRSLRSGTFTPLLSSGVEVGRVSTDRPIDGIDSSDLLLGRSDRSSRDHVLFYGSDGEILSVKWKTMKVVFRYAESTSGPIIRPQLPLIFDLIEDPKEAWDLVQMRMDCAWVTAPAIQRIGALLKSTAKYPNIKPGQEFEGYKYDEKRL
jgi:hypothetical protein